VTVNGEIFHQECLSCACCKEPIEGDHFTYEDRKICVKCNYTELPKCAKCANPIGDKVISAGDQHFHAKCFACSSCGEVMEGDYVAIEGRNVCIHCHDHKLPRCAKCALPIGGAMKTVEGKTFHTDCFRCSCCNGLIDGRHCAYDNQNVCLACNRNRLPKCAHCFRPIGTDIINAGGKQFHEECFSSGASPDIPGGIRRQVSAPTCPTSPRAKNINGMVSPQASPTSSNRHLMNHSPRPIGNRSPRPIGNHSPRAIGNRSPRPSTGRHSIGTIPRRQSGSFS